MPPKRKTDKAKPNTRTPKNKMQDKRYTVTIPIEGFVSYSITASTPEEAYKKALEDKAADTTNLEWNFNPGTVYDMVEEET